MSVVKEYAAELWQNLSEGKDRLYEKYKSLIAANSATYEKEIAALDPQYEALKSNAAVKSRIDAANTQAKMVDRGIAVSGESLQHELLSNAALQSNLSALDRQKQSEKSKLASEKSTAETKLLSDESDEVSQYIYKMNQSYFDQLNRDRESALEAQKLELEEKEKEAARALAERKQNLAEEQFAFEQKVKTVYSASSGKSSSSSGKSSSSSASANQTMDMSRDILGMGGSKFTTVKSPSSSYTPEAKAITMVDSIVKRYSNSVAGVSTYNTGAIRSAIQVLVKNTSLDQSYRYDIAIYAKSLGFL